MRRPSAAWIGPLLLSSLLGLLAAEPAQTAHAQRSENQLGLGAQVGRPSGLTTKLYRHAQLGYDLSLGWDLDGFFLINVHRVHEHPLPNSPLHVFAGPGLFAGADWSPVENRVTFGISGNFGLNFFKERFEVFLQMTPRLRLYSKTRGRLGGGVGLRYFL